MNFLRIAILCCMLGLTACTPRTVHENPPATAQQAVTQSIDELNVSIAAASSTLLDGYKSGAVTWAEFTDSRDTLNTAATYRDQAAVLLAGGDIDTANGKLALANSLLTLVQKRLVAMKGTAK